MTMVFCRGCAKEIHEKAQNCPHCGFQQLSIQQVVTPQTSSPRTSLSTNDSTRKFHLTLVVTATIAVILLYATMAIPFVFITTGLCLGLCIRLYLIHNVQQFKDTKKLDWALLLCASGLAFVLMFLDYFHYQAPLLVFVAIRGLILYFSIYSNKAN